MSTENNNENGNGNGNVVVAIMSFHRKAVSYMEAIRSAVSAFVEDANPPEGLPAEMVEAARQEARRHANVLGAAIEVMCSPPIVSLVVLRASAAQEAREADSPEARLTSRKVAQA